MVFLKSKHFLWFSLQPAVHVQGQEPLTASMLAAAPPQEQKQMLGEWSYRLLSIMLEYVKSYA